MTKGRTLQGSVGGDVQLRRLELTSGEVIKITGGMATPIFLPRKSAM